MVWHNLEMGVTPQELLTGKDLKRKEYWGFA